MQTDPVRETCATILNKPLPGGKPLHWQPNPAHTLIQYNTIGDGKLHVLDSASLKWETHPGGGRHSNMAFFENDRWLVATDRLRDGTTLRVVDRRTSAILCETPTGGWGHGVTVNERTKRAFVWAKDGVHVVSLRRKTLGKHLGVMPPAHPRERCWFCWTPQGGRFSHDQTWGAGDVFGPRLTVLDMDEDRLFGIEAKGEALGTLGISPDGKLGACGSHNSRNLCVFDIHANRLLGKARVGKGKEGFFDRDVSFSSDRMTVFVTDPPDGTLSAVDVKTGERIRVYELPAKPEWMKVLTA